MVEADKLQTMLTKINRQVSQFKGRMLKGKVGGGGEVRTQRLVHDEGDASTTGTDRRWCMQYPGGARSAYLALSPPGCSHNSVVQSKKHFLCQLSGQG